MTRRVLSLSTLYPNAHTPRFGTFVARSLEALAARGDWQVTLINPVGIPPIVFGKYRPLAEAAVSGVENGVEVHRPTFPLIPKIGARSNPSRVAKAVLSVARGLHERQPFDIVDAQFFWPDGPAAAQVAQALGLPLSIKARGSDITFWGEKDFARHAMVKAARQASGLLSVSKALARDMIDIGMPAEKITLHYTGLDRDRFRPLDHVGLRARLGERLGIALPAAENLLVTVGALIERKGQDIVIGALAAVGIVVAAIVYSRKKRTATATPTTNVQMSGGAVDPVAVGVEVPAVSKLSSEASKDEAAKGKGGFDKI